MATEVTKQEHSMSAEVTAQIIQNLREYGDIVKPGYGIGYNAGSKNQGEFTKENYLRWAAYDATSKKDLSRGFVEEGQAKELGYTIKKGAVPFVVERYDADKKETVLSNFINLSDLKATDKVQNPITEKEMIPGDSEEAYTKIGDKLAALKFNRMPGDTGNAEEIQKNIFNYAKKQQVDGKDGKQPASYTAAALASSLFMRENGILPSADKPLLTEQQIKYLEEKPSRIFAFMKQAHAIVEKIDGTLYVHQHPEEYKDAPRSVKADRIIKSKDFKENGWKNLAYLYVTKPPKGVSPEEHNVTIVKNMIEDGRTEGQMDIIVKVAGNKIPLKDILKSQEIKEYRKELQAVSKEQKKTQAKSKAMTK